MTLLSRSQALEQLETLRKDPANAALYRWTTALVTHDAGTVNMNEVMKLVFQPKAFWENGDLHVPSDLLPLVKPSNLLHIDGLDLSAVDLRQAVVTGVLDRLQVHDALEVQIRVPVSRVYDSVREALSAALGSTDEMAPRKPLAQRRVVLFSAVSELLGALPSPTTVSDFLEQRVTVDTDTEQKILKLVYHPDFGMRERWHTLTATMHVKSNEKAVLAGNDTASCMPLGAAKFSHFLLSPIVGHFTLQIERAGSGIMRTMAQSIVTRDVDIGQPLPRPEELLANRNLIFQQSDTPKKDNFISLDNVEPAPRYRKDYEGISLMDLGYSQFFKIYLQRFASAQGVRDDFIPVGKGFSPDFSWPSIENSFAPLMPLGYSDKLGPQVFVLNANAPTPAVFIEVNELAKERIDWGKANVHGVRLMRPTDVREVCRAEYEIYSQSRLCQGPILTTNRYLASVISNEMKGRPHLSLVAQRENKLLGYLTAYECGPKRYIYIDDWVCRPEHRGSGAHLLDEFLSRYKANYLDRGTKVPVVVDLRDGTSFRMLPRLLERASKRLGLTISFHESQRTGLGDDSLHRIEFHIAREQA